MRVSNAPGMVPANQVNMPYWAAQWGQHDVSAAAASRAFGSPVFLASAGVKAQQNRGAKQSNDRVMVEGVSLPRFQPQEAMSKRYTAADLDRLGVNANNTRIYVIDDFTNRDTRAGVGPTSVKVAHGDVTAGIIRAMLKGRGAVISMDAGARAGSGGFDSDLLLKRFNEVIVTEAKRQNKTTATVDLSAVSINFSGGVGLKGPRASEILHAMTAFTSRGGHLFASAGNDEYSPSASVVKNTTIVDGSKLRIGQAVPKVQQPWSEYKNGAVDESGKDVRSRRALDSSSRSIVAPSTIVTRVFNRTVEFRDDSSPTGWTKLIDASRTKPAPTPTTTPDGLVGLRPQRLVSGVEVKKFQEWQYKTYFDAQANPKNISPDGSELLTPEATAVVDKKVALEMKIRLGEKPVMTLDEYLKLRGFPPDSKFAQEILATVPDGMTPRQVLVSATQAKDSKMAERFELQYFRLDRDMGLQPIQPLTNMTSGTSWSAPYAAASHAFWQREQIAAAKAR